MFARHPGPSLRITSDSFHEPGQGKPKQPTAKNQATTGYHGSSTAPRTEASAIHEETLVSTRRSAPPPTPLMAAVFLFALAACAPDGDPPDATVDHSAPGAAPARDVLLITVDTLRPDHLGIYGYDRETTPHLDELFGEGIVYERCYSTEASTSPSVVSLLTGQLPQEHGVRLLYQMLPEDTALVCDALRPEYVCAGFIANVVLTDEALGIAKRFDHYDDFVDEKEPRRDIFERNAERTSDAVVRWLDTAWNPQKPLFLWVHYIDPHGPYRPPENLPRRFKSDQQHPIPPERVPGYTRVEGVSNGHYYVDRYDEEIAYTDAQIQRVIDAYAKVRDVDEALILFTADHGESMMEHERWFTHGYHVYEEIVRVPLLVRGPDIHTQRSDALVSGIDVTPTILRFAQRSVPDGLPTTDLRFPERIAEGRVIHTEASLKQQQWRAAFRGRDKWMVVVSPDGRMQERRHYDLEADPGEQQPGNWKNAAAPPELHSWIQSDPDPAGIPSSYRQGMKVTSPKVAPDLDQETLERLQALGYVDGEDG